jgi:hypothetical protein
MALLGSIVCLSGLALQVLQQSSQQQQQRQRQAPLLS